MARLPPASVDAHYAGMSSGADASTVRQIHRWGGTDLQSVADVVVVEEPLELRALGRPLAIIMRTPGHDTELVRGLLHAEGLIRMGELDWALTQTEANVVTLEMSEPLINERWAERNVISNSACGVCGAAALAVLEELATPVRSDLQWTPEQVLSIPPSLRADQELFAKTGALHAAALFDRDAQLIAIREDVGRHSAVDKVIGWALNESRYPLSACALGVSGRLSYEIVHKAVAAALPMVVAVSAPSSLAVDMGERWRVTLVGFTRDTGFNVYSHPSRIVAAVEAG